MAADCVTYCLPPVHSLRITVLATAAAATSLVCSFVLVAGCGSSSAGQKLTDTANDAAAASDGANDDAPADAGSDAYVPQAPHCTAQAKAPDPFDAGGDGAVGVTALPIVSNSGGKLLRQPSFVSVTFPDDPYANDVEDFIASVGCTEYWHATTSEYGIGDAVALPPVRLTEKAAAAVDDGAIAGWIGKEIQAGHLPKATTDILYILFYPATTTLTLSMGGQTATSCMEFGGYHNEGTLPDGTTVSYAVLPRCHDPRVSSDLDLLTGATSHEIIEAVTDPLPQSLPSYQLTDINHLAWAVTGLGTEVGDMCAPLPGVFFRPQGLPWLVQRTWSNKAAWSGASPCVPAPTADYFWAAAELPDTIMVNLTGTPQAAAVVHVPVSGSATIPVKLTATGAVTGPITVQARDFSQLLGGPAYMTLSLSPTSGNPGDTLQLTINKTAGDPTNHVEVFQLVATSGNARTSFLGLSSD
jgi:hypothetical protein